MVQTIVRLLADSHSRGHFPAWLRVIATTRRDDRILKEMQFADENRVHIAVDAIDNSEDAKANADDIRQFVMAAIMSNPKLVDAALAFSQAPLASDEVVIDVAALMTDTLAEVVFVSLRVC